MTVFPVRLHRPAWCGLLLAAFALAAPAARADTITRDVNITLDAAAISSYDLDVDQNGTTDFTFTAAFVPDPFLSVGFDTVDFPFASTNGVVIDFATGDGFPTVTRLGLGGVVTATDTFSFGSFDQGNLFFFTSFDAPTGNFEGQTGYVGLRFVGAAGTLYGYAQVTVNALDATDNPLGLTIGTVAFNDVPDASITIAPAAVDVPAPAGVVLFAVGLCGVGFVRRRTKVTV